MDNQKIEGEGMTRMSSGGMTRMSSIIIQDSNTPRLKSRR
jgi:hypothetical protein